ncbi:MAG: sulfite exporter TauE/SafE family protein [Verrucomicrobiae bacterium]|nr:sulfite exporter TauE/SafE family protein [Verrucomicrobiae bacterium]
MMNNASRRSLDLKTRTGYASLGVGWAVGFPWAAGAGAVAAGDWFGGVTTMAVFGLGTVPMMLGLSLCGAEASLCAALQAATAHSRQPDDRGVAADPPRACAGDSVPQPGAGGKLPELPLRLTPAR